MPPGLTVQASRMRQPVTSCGPAGRRRCMNAGSTASRPSRPAPCVSSSQVLRTWRTGRLSTVGSAAAATTAVGGTVSTNQ